MPSLSTEDERPPCCKHAPNYQARNAGRSRAPSRQTLPNSPLSVAGKARDGKSVNICLNISNEAEKSALRKNIQQKQTKWNVMTMPKKRRMPRLRSPFFRPVMPIQNLWTAKATPCNIPQNTKFQEAPCHKPPRNMVMIRLAYWRILPLRLPPRDI